MSLLPLRVEGAVLRRGGRVLVGPVDLTLGPGGVTAVIGPNGSGKTSLLRLMHGLEAASEGRVAWSVPEALARARQAYVFQDPIVLRRSVEANLAFPLRLRGVGRAAARARAREVAARFGLAERLAQPAPSLSGGEMQRLALARAMATAPEVLFADEPCAALDGAATREIEARLMDLAAEGTRLVIATHDLGQARRIASEVVFMLHGRAHETAPAAPFFAAPRTAEAQAFLRGDIVE